MKCSSLHKDTSLHLPRWAHSPSTQPRFNSEELGRVDREEDEAPLTSSHMGSAAGPYLPSRCIESFFIFDLWLLFPWDFTSLGLFTSSTFGHWAWLILELHWVLPLVLLLMNLSSCYRQVRPPPQKDLLKRLSKALRRPKLRAPTDLGL